ncbi:hypothetical protein CC86DRAFT_290629 [Ophiobolus disseminans]|uniref:Uncharacterized protein n=1 Tax=Ophiobolus disseminans TaxID=1469910 RepID=A0A6A7A458_9PLEO|nr:hypothetical protein CC86DRAFT_290629 [Ophiobolus disseminans]
MSAFDLKKSAKTKEAQAKAGHNKPQWDRFYYITKIEIDNFIKAQPDITWHVVPYNVINEYLIRVNEKLVKEGIPEVEYDVFSWRMARALQYRTASKSCKALLLLMD